jgi:hypothetical protein
LTSGTGQPLALLSQGDISITGGSINLSGLQGGPGGPLDLPGLSARGPSGVGGTYGGSGGFETGYAARNGGGGAGPYVSSSGGGGGGIGGIGGAGGGTAPGTGGAHFRKPGDPTCRWFRRGRRLGGHLPPPLPASILRWRRGRRRRSHRIGGDPLAHD